MGFWDMLGEAAGKALKEQKEKYGSASRQAGNLDDDSLLEKMKGENSIAKKMAYAEELKRRTAYAAKSAEYLNDKELYEKWRDTDNTADKIAYAQELKRRAYGKQED